MEVVRFHQKMAFLVIFWVFFVFVFLFLESVFRPPINRSVDVVYTDFELFEF